MAIRWTDATSERRLPPLPRSLAGTPGQQAMVDVWICPEVDRLVRAHLQEQTVEQGGLLIGQAYADPDTGALAHVRVLDYARADDAEGTAVSLRMATGVWQRAQALLTPCDLIVGWYHSHPGLGAFFSDTDRQTQRAFFNHPYSLGWVIDPLTADEALFLGGDCRCVQRGPDRVPQAPRTGRG